MKKPKLFRRGQKVIFIPEGKTYDFGYYSQIQGKGIIYEEGCRNMQDSVCVDLIKLKKVRSGPLPKSQDKHDLGRNI